MTHDPMALIIAAPVLLAAVYFGWTGFRSPTPIDNDAEDDES